MDKLKPTKKKRFFRYKESSKTGRAVVKFTLIIIAGVNIIGFIVFLVLYLSGRIY